MERLLEKQKELTERVRANEKVVAAIGLFGSVAVAFIGAGYFAPSAEANPNEWMQKIRDHKAEQTRTPPEESINRSLDLWEDTEDGSDDTPKQEELLQLPSSNDRQGT